MWMWWDHYIYCNFWAHAVVHRVHHTPTRRLECREPERAFHLANLAGYFFVPSLWAASSRALESLYVDGIRTPDSTPLSRAHAGPCARGASALRLTGVRRSCENEIERSPEKSGKKSPLLLSPRPNTESWCRINEAVWHDSVPFGLTVWIKLSPLSSHKCTQGIAYYSNCGPYGGHATPHSRLS